MKTKMQKEGTKTRGGYRENAGRNSTWRHQETCTIRIPKNLSKKLLELANLLDNMENIDKVTFSKLSLNDLVKESKIVDIQMTSTDFFYSDQGTNEIDTESKVINYTAIQPEENSWLVRGDNQHLDSARC